MRTAHRLATHVVLMPHLCQTRFNKGATAFATRSAASAALADDALLERAQAPFDLADIGGHGMGISGLTKHDLTPGNESKVGLAHQSHCENDRRIVAVEQQVYDLISAIVFDKKAYTLPFTGLSIAFPGMATVAYLECH